MVETLSSGLASICVLPIWKATGTPWNGVLEKLIVTYLVKKFPA
jgi:hypothetical protein